MLRWFVLSQKVIEKEFALSGSEQNPDLSSGKWIEVIKARLLSRGGAPGPVEAFKEHGADFVVADTIDELATGMNGIAPGEMIDADRLRAEVAALRLALEEKEV